LIITRLSEGNKTAAQIESVQYRSSVILLLPLFAYFIS
jgi:hypothetical protein